MLSLVSLWMLCVIFWDSILSIKILFFQSFVYSLPIHLNFECKVYNHIFTGHESKFYSETEPKFQHQLGNFVTKMKFTLENLISKVVDFSFSTSHQCSFHVIFFSSISCLQILKTQPLTYYKCILYNLTHFEIYLVPTRMIDIRIPNKEAFVNQTILEITNN